MSYDIKHFEEGIYRKKIDNEFVYYYVNIIKKYPKKI